VTFVLDASAALAWVYERAAPEEASAARALLARLDREEALVPELWHLEVLNALIAGHRKGVISVAKATDFLARLDALPIRTQGEPLAGRKEQLFALAREHDLSAYDAACLDLAIRSGSALATFDGKLRLARDKAGVAAA
jgi:predicted nucleic acid-binding protein